MNFFKYYLIAGFLLFPLLLHSQISNVQVSTEGDQVIITYDYAAQDESIDDITVTYTTGNEADVKEAKQVTGDVHNITPGTGKRIVWSPLSEMESFSADNLVIHLKGVRDPAKQEECDNNLKLADKFYADKSYDNALNYYSELLNCQTCNCNPKDKAYATKQINKLKISMGIKDRYFVSYLYDMATAEGGNSMHGMSAFLLRSKIGYYASFRSDKNFYLPQNNMSYYTDDEKLKNNYELNSLGNSRISSWIFSTGLTAKIVATKYVTPYFYGGVGLGTNTLAGEYEVTERGFTDKFWITDGIRNLFLSPEIGVIANIYNVATVMAGIKFPFSLTTNTDLTTKGFSAMAGIGIDLKTLAKNSYRRTNTYIAYVIDLPQQSGPDKIQSANVIGFSAGTVSYSKLGGYFSVRINPLLFNAKQTTELDESAVYTGVYDHANAFGTVGFTWMYFYGGVGASYQKEFKSYTQGGEEIWNSERNKVGLCTEFGVNLRLFDRLLLRGGVTFPDFRMSSQNSEFKMGSNQMFFTLGLGYVLSSSSK